MPENCDQETGLDGSEKQNRIVAVFIEVYVRQFEVQR